MLKLLLEGVSTVQLKKYNSILEHSYSLGAFPTIELLKNKAEYVMSIYIHSDWENYIHKQLINDLCQAYHIPIVYNNKVVEYIRDKENCYVVGFFRKYSTSISKDKNHIVLVNPSDMGNVGTIIRTCLGFGNNNIAIINPSVDIFNPKVIRASMGAIYQVNLCMFDSFEQYCLQNIEHQIYSFMLNGKQDIMKIKHDQNKKYSLVFGNEAKGLDNSFLEKGESVYISHSGKIDSLNLSLAVGIGIYEFTRVKCEN
jgi:TrmH family RNA methyltransferase